MTGADLISGPLREAAERERDDVRSRLREAEETVRDLRLSLDRLDALLEPARVGEGLRGAKLGRKCREVLAAAGAPMHYRDVYERIAADHHIGGRDPLASTLTALTRDPYIRRVNGGRSGTYEAFSA